MDDIDRISLDFAIHHPDSFARIIGRGEVGDCQRIVESLPANRKAAIVARLPALRIRQLLDSGQHRPADWLVAAPFDDAVTLLSRIPREQRLALINSLDDRHRQRQLLRNQQYPAHSIGSLVGDILLRVSAESPATGVMAELRELDAEAQGPVVVVDADGHYLGVLDRWRLILRETPTGSAKDYLIAVQALQAETPVSVVALNDEWNTRNWLPVIDHRHRVLGAVTREKVLRVAGAHSGSGSGGGNLLLELLADFVYLCDAVLIKALPGKHSA